MIVRLTTPVNFRTEEGTVAKCTAPHPSTDQLGDVKFLVLYILDQRFFFFLFLTFNRSRCAVVFHYLQNHYVTLNY